MDGLEDYSTVEQPTLDDFQSSKDAVAPVFNKPSVTAYAAKSAAFSSKPDQVVDNYQAVVNEQTINGQSQTADNLIQDAKKNHFTANRSALLNLMGDPNVPDAVKQKAISQVYDANSDLYSVDRMLQTSSLNSAVKNETQEEELVRVDTSKALNQIDNVRYQQQAMYNAEVAKINPTTSEKAADLLGSLIPFGQRHNIGELRSQLTGENVWSYVKALVDQGGAKQDIADAIMAMPPEDRLRTVQQTIDFVNAHNGIVAGSDNQLQNLSYLQQYLTEGGYEKADRVADTVAGILDFTMLGAAKGAKAASAAESLDAKFTSGAADLGDKVRAAVSARTLESNVARDTTKSTTQPLSLSQTFKDTNVDKYRSTFDIAANDTSGSAAEATHNASRADAISGDALPEVGHVDGSVKAKPSDPDANDIMREAPDPELVEFVNYDSGNKYFQAEKASARAHVVNDFQQALGMTSRKEMFQYADTPAGVSVKGVYGPPVSGYSNVYEAVDLAKWAFRNYGIDESNIKILSRNGSEYHPISMDDARQMGNTGDFLVQVDYNHTIRNDDVMDWITPTSKYNFLDRMNMSGNRGTITSNFLDAASIHDPVIFKAATTATDREAGLEKILLKMAGDHAKDYLKLSEGEQDLLYKVYQQGNDSGINYTRTQLKGMGLNDKQMDVYSKFRAYNDNMWYLENRAYAKKLNADGYYQFVHPATDSNLLVRPVGRNNLAGLRFYDVETDSFPTMSNKELSDLYDKGGTIAKIRKPIPVGSELAEHIIVRNDPKGSYLRGITQDSNVLAYRPGYYKVNYKDPHFIEEVIKNGKGEVVGHKPVATAPSIKQADLMVSRLSKASGKEYRRRYAKELNMDGRKDAEIDMAVAQGRSAQRFRGKRLEDSTSNIFNLEQANIKNPVEVMVDSARSISRYLTVGDVIDTMKQRITETYKDYLPKGEYGQPLFPTNAKDLKYRGNGTEDRAKLADARSAIAYTNFLQHGYVNALDDGFKAIMRELADITGAKGFETAETKLREVGATKALSGRAKGVTFNLLIALNPLRQFAVQAHQAVMLTSINPTWALSGRGFNQTAFMVARQLGLTTKNMPATMLTAFEKATGMTSAELEQMGKQYDLTGQGASIDKHALVSGNLSDLADRMVAKSQRGIANKILAAPRAVLTGARKIGFDMGEYINTTTSWLAHRDLAVKNGLDMNNTEVAAEVAAKARNFTGNMNRAGDMPYNETELGIILTYQQNAHKLFLNMLTNRVLTPVDKLRFGAFYFTMFGVGTAAAYSQFFDNIMPKDPKDRQLVATGLEAVLFNKAASFAMGDKVNIDFSTLSPVDMYGTTELIHSLFTTDAGEILSHTPAGSLFLGSNPRVSKFLKTAASYFNLVDDYDDPTTFGQVALDFAKMSSGFSNLFKAQYLYEHQKKITSTGKTKDMNVPSIQAVAQAFGLGDADEAIINYMNQDRMKVDKESKDDVKKWYQGYRSKLADKTITPDQIEYITKMYTEAFRVWNDKKGKDLAMSEINKLLMQDVADGDGTFYNSVLRQNDIIDSETLKARVNALQRTDDETKASLIRAIDFQNKFKGTDKEK